MEHALPADSQQLMGKRGLDAIIHLAIAIHVVHALATVHANAILQSIMLKVC